MNIWPRTIAFGIAGLVVGLVAVLLLNTGVSVEAENALGRSSVISTVYPLFSQGISWTSQVSVTLPPLSDYNPTKGEITGYQVTSLPTASTKDIGGTVEPMRNYYDQLLIKNGWSIEVNFEADGPGGSLWGFRKDNKILIFSYTSTFYDREQGTPAQCPCTVVFTIIGGTLH